MSDPGFTRSDLCSIRAADEQAESLERRAAPCRWLLAVRTMPGPAVRRARAWWRAVTAIGRRQDDDRARGSLRRLSCDCGEQYRPRHPPVHGGSCARCSGHRGCLMSPTGTPTRSSGPTARAGSPLGSSQPRSTASSTPPAWSSCTRHGTGTGTSPGPLAARAGHRGHPHGEHGPGLVTRSRRSGGRGLASGQPRRACMSFLVWLIRISGTPGTRAIGSALRRRYGMPRCGAFVQPQRSTASSTAGVRPRSARSGLAAERVSLRGSRPRLPALQHADGIARSRGR